jgi:hypothetical protein
MLGAATDTDCVSASLRHIEHETPDLSCLDSDTSDRSHWRSGFFAFCPGVFFGAGSQILASTSLALARGRQNSLPGDHWRANGRVRSADRT